MQTKALDLFKINNRFQRIQKNTQESTKRKPINKTIEDLHAFVKSTYVHGLQNFYSLIVIEYKTIPEKQYSRDNPGKLKCLMLS